MIAQSLANLVKTNKGIFKSPAQAAFLLSKCDGNEFVTTGGVYGNSYAMFYTLDDIGVVKVQKQTVAKGLVLVWERAEEGKISIQDEKEIKRLKRLIKQTEKSISEREISRANGDYSDTTLFEISQKKDQEKLDGLTQMLCQMCD